MSFRTIVRLPSLLLACLGSLIAAMAMAATTPEEDYRTGARRYAEGDVMTAMTHLKLAADAGHAAAQAFYGLILDRADSDEEAVAYYRKSAEQGHADGQFGYGSMLASGEGIKRDVVAGRQWITRAAEQGHKLAINELALAYVKGQLEIAEAARNDEEALRWVRMAAENEFVPAMEALADAYRRGGYGLPTDSKLADDWESRARKARGLLGKRKGGKK